MLAPNLPIFTRQFNLGGLLVLCQGKELGLRTKGIGGKVPSKRQGCMDKKYVVRLIDEERAVCQEIVKKLKGSGQKFRRAQIMLKADADGPGWTDVKIAEAFNCRVQTVENLRKRLVLEGFELALNGRKRLEPPTRCKLDGEGEAKLIAMRLGKPPTGYGHWTLRLLADEMVTLEVVDAISHETVRNVLKKMA